MSSIGGGDSAPTAAEHEFFEEKRREADAQINAWKKLLDEDVAALNQKIRAEGIPVIQAPPSSPGSATGRAASDGEVQDQ